MYAYCRNEPVFRKDAFGTEDVCVTNTEDDDNPLNDYGKSPSGGGTGGGKGLSNASKKFTTDQSAVIELAKECRKGITASESQILLEWANVYGIKNHGIMIHPMRSGIWSYTYHIKIANIHIPVIKE